LVERWYQSVEQRLHEADKFVNKLEEEGEKEFDSFSLFFDSPHH
jgi:hypothetical protein